MTTLLSVSVALFAGLMMTRILNRFKLPDVTSYLVAGVLIGPSCLGLLGLNGIGFTSYEQIEGLKIISDIALGFIAFSIGNEFRLSDLKKIGKQAFTIGVIQAVAASVLVDIVLVILHFVFPDLLSLPAAITLGAIASATAPAATLMVVRQFKAKGELTDLLLPIVALDDAVGLVVFAVSFGIARAMSSGTVSVISTVVNPLIEISASLLLGAVAGVALTYIERLFHSNRNRMAMSITFVFVTVAVSMLKLNFGEVSVGFSSLLVCMMLGTVFCNICPMSEDIMDRCDRWTAPLFVLFFVISGAELELSIFKNPAVVLIGVIYIITRSAGKYSGTRLSAKMSGCSANVKKYLGFALFPQAGVALGMCVTAQQLGDDGSIIRNIVLFAVLVYELIGPSITKWALTRSGDITPPERDAKSLRAEKLELSGRKEYSVGGKKK